MSFLDKARGLLKGKEKHVETVIDKVADIADDKTSGKHTDTIGDAAAKAKDVVKKLDS
ncbi:MAG: antitoxin [Acidimicrobiales bacterium]